MENIKLNSIEPAVTTNGKEYWQINVNNNQRVSVWDKDIAEFLTNAVGQNGTFMGEITQKDKYSNLIKVDFNSFTVGQPNTSISLSLKDEKIVAQVFVKCATELVVSGKYSELKGAINDLNDAYKEALRLLNEN